MKQLFDLHRLSLAAKSAKYNPVQEDESSEKDSFFSDTTDRGSNVRPSTFRSISVYLLLALQAIVLFVLVIYVARGQTPTDLACAKQLSPYCKTFIQNVFPLLIRVAAPFLESGDLEFQEFTDKNHLMQPSIYRGQPTPEIEAAWISLWRSKEDFHRSHQFRSLSADNFQVPTIKFPESKLAALNKSPPSSYAHVAPEYGEGALGFLDVFHQLHCLVCLRLPPINLRLTVTEHY